MASKKIVHLAKDGRFVKAAWQSIAALPLFF